MSTPTTSDPTQPSSRRNHNLAWLAPLIFLPLALSGPNTILALYACFVLGLGTTLLWRPGEPPILLLIFVFQWSQAALGLFYGNLVSLPINSVAAFSGRDELSVFLLLTGLLILALAIRLSIGPPIRDLLPRARSVVAARPLSFWLSLFVAAWLFSAACSSVAGMDSGLEQPLRGLANVKWAAFVLLTLATFSCPGRRIAIWLAVAGFEFALSIGGYFSSFKDVLLYALIGLLASHVRLNVRAVLAAATVIIVLLSFGVVWTAIKPDYRAFANGGTEEQVISVAYTDRIAELVSLMSKLDAQDLSNAADQMLQRIMYFQFFGVVLERVPDIVPYSNGRIWREAVLRPITPRLLFPGKSNIDDSELTNRYTGLGFATASRGTSISMGYMTEAYIDFGPVFMFVPIAVLGCFLGYFYRWLLVRPGPSAVLGMALAPFALMPALFLETSALKMVPALGLTAIVCWVVLKLIGPWFLELAHRNKPRPNTSGFRGIGV